MSLEDLRNGTALQIPDINLPVFASADNIFPVNNARGNTISAICMAGVCLDASRGVIVPKADSRVLCRGQ